VAALAAHITAGYTTHDLRHFTASALIAHGATVKQVQTVLGHSSATVTLRTYTHLFPDDHDRMHQIMDMALGENSADYLRTPKAMS
jgi:integrase